MAALTYVGAGLFATLGLLHLIYTVRDAIGPPRYFKPRDAALLDPLRATKVALAPGGRDFWSTLIGFHFSHSFGALLFALVAVLATLYGIGWLKPVVVMVGAAYTVVAWRYWFAIPLAGCGLGTVLIAAGWIV